MADWIALEEHVVFPSFVDYLIAGLPRVSADAKDRILSQLSDFGDQRLKAMDASGVDIAVLSISGPGVQIEPDAALAIARAREANELLAAEIARQPNRYRGFAHLAMQNPVAAADELQRTVEKFGFVGAMVNGHTNGVYLDDSQYDPFWERLQDLDVPLYLHPADSFVKPYALEGCDELLKPTWEWTFETATHFLRLVFSGVFDRFPRLKIILGHMGETLPFILWRLDSRAALTAGKRPLELPPSAYLRRNLFVTTSGVFSEAPLVATVTALGHDRVMYSVDYPYEDGAVAKTFLESISLDEDTRMRIGRRNAQQLLRL
jgi:2,3-dihydroxybenzoate decarboxylase